MKLKAYLLATAITLTSASAHGIWITPHYGELGIVYGMGAYDDSYSTEKVKEVKAYDKNFKATNIKLNKHANYVSISPEKNTSIITSFFNNGYWEKGKVKKWVAVEKDEIKSAKDTSTSLKYNISILDSYEGEMKPFKNLPVQIIPHTNPAKLHQGDKVTVTVYVGGKPKKDVTLTADYINDFQNKIKTDKDGKATLIIRNAGLNVFAALVPHKTPNDKFAHLQRTVSTLSFKASKKK